MLLLLKFAALFTQEIVGKTPEIGASSAITGSGTEPGVGG
jgi:hypothetical protein